MISYIKGQMVNAEDGVIVVENQGIGYEISVPANVQNQMPPEGHIVKIYTYLYVREDVLKLYGFLSKEDVQIFKLLITVSGIGPKGALGILSAISPDDLRFAILANDAKAIAKAPGIGIKTAGKLILELKDKMKLEDAYEIKKKHAEEQLNGSDYEGVRKDASEALMALGYSGTEAWKAVRKVEITENMDAGELLKATLKQMDRF